MENKNFKEFLNNPIFNNLVNFLKGHTGEQDQCDFKENWTPDWSKTARHILGIANCGKGAIIVGIEDKTFKITGLRIAEDKAVIHDKLKQFVPDKLDYSIKDLFYPNIYQDEEFQGRKFQVIIIGDNQCKVPFVPMSDGKDIKKGNVYIRIGTKTESANYDQLQEIISRRIEMCSKINKLPFLDYKKWRQISNIDTVKIYNMNYTQFGNYYRAKLLEYNLQTQTAIVAMCTTENHVERYLFKMSRYLQFEEYGIYVKNMTPEYISLEMGIIPSN